MTLLKKPFPLSLHLVLLVLAAMIPFFIFSAIIVNQLTQYERDASEARLRQSTRQLALSLDQETETTIRTLQALAVSEELVHNDLKNLHKRLAKVLATQSTWMTILLHNSDRKLILNAGVPNDERLAGTAEPSSLEALFKTGKPNVGYVARGRQRGPGARRWGFAVRVPVFVENEIKYVLSTVITTESLQDIVKRFTLSPDEWTRTITDSRGTIAARSRNPQEFVGEPATASYLQLVSTSSSGLVRETSMEGEPVYLSYYRAPLSQWTAAVVVPTRTLEAPVRRSMMIVVSVGFTLLLVFGGLALLYSRSLAKRISSAAAGAKELARGGVPSVKQSMVAEVEQLRGSLLSAAQLLAKREDERNEHLMQANAAKAEAEEANHAKSQFLANMSHELRAPLNVVLGYAELLSKDLIAQDEKDRIIDVISSNKQRLLKLIDDILDLSKTEASQLELEMADLSLSELVSDVLANFDLAAEEKKIDLSMNVDGPIPAMIHSDPVRVRQIVSNIVDNAIKFTSEGWVKVTLRMDQTYVYIIVADTGIGLTEAQQTKLFSIFSQVDSSRSKKYAGTGLGLALSKRMALLLGGDVELVESRPTKGSTFKISIKS